MVHDEPNGVLSSFSPVRDKAIHRRVCIVRNEDIVGEMIEFLYRELELAEQDNERGCSGFVVEACGERIHLVRIFFSHTEYVVECGTVRLIIQRDRFSSNIFCG